MASTISSSEYIQPRGFWHWYKGRVIGFLIGFMTPIYGYLVFWGFSFPNIHLGQRELANMLAAGLLTMLIGTLAGFMADYDRNY